MPPVTDVSQACNSSGGNDPKTPSEEDEFKANLCQYSRSVIESAMDHSSKETEALEDTMRLSKAKVIVQYEQTRDTITTLEEELSEARETLRQSAESITILKADQARLNADLKLEMTITDDAKRMYKAQLAKEKKDYVSWKKEEARRKKTRDGDSYS